MHDKELKIRRALFTVSDKEGIVPLARALRQRGAEIVATGRTAQVLKDAEIPVVPIEQVSGSPEAFQGRMKTLSFPVCSGILYRRGDAQDEADLAKLAIQPIDCVVVNFYPFEQAAAKEGISRRELIEEIDIGGPTLVRAAAKNSPSVLVLTSPGQYARVISELEKKGTVGAKLADECAAEAWARILSYDQAIAARFAGSRTELRYGENPHQHGFLDVAADSPIAWPRTDEERLTAAELSYNNILDLSGAYSLASDLVSLEPGATSVVIVKHNNPCGVATVPKAMGRGAQKQALQRAWEGDPVSAFGGVLVFTDPIEEEVATWLAERFVELVAAPGLVKGTPALNALVAKRRNLKAVTIHRFGAQPRESTVDVPGARLVQTTDLGIQETLTSVTKKPFPKDQERLARFGIAVCRALKSNAISLVREIGGALQLIGAGQGQPNRIEALEKLAAPRANRVLAETGGVIGDAILISDAFFPFRDTIDTAHAIGIRKVIQPGGSIKDAESIAACDEHGIAMAFTGIRHFRH
ncbi:MAG TPA: bifunctional phosphoribosylaminoimidazolecarboxamide formyltransferase/IMP cyclohydrolase [Bdellovibrionota bacterium]|nr:bifunctional phosphoribosylaminoimidazolecarboxamide formyltransferase/IMP cyclohydrolase [Bdellovibrionota bacterium]